MNINPEIIRQLVYIAGELIIIILTANGPKEIRR